jgi:protein arginine kinase activator
MTMKCQKCAKSAVFHITEVLGEYQYEELHLCEDCAQAYLNQAQQPKKPPTKSKEPSLAEEQSETSAMNGRKCPVCGIKFAEFRNSGRLGCANDYEHFIDELTPLLQNIHGEIKHVGKTPRRLPQTRQIQQELTQLRKQLQRAILEEAYEDAARIRDRIKQLEQS